MTQTRQLTKSGDFTSLRRLFAKTAVSERYGDISTVDPSSICYSDAAGQMALRVTIRDDAAPLTVEDGSQLDVVLHAADEEARTSEKLNGVVIEADNGNRLLMVVGSEETVLIFNYGGEDPPYYASKGASDNDDPLMTCYITFQHHTEFPRSYVISFADGVKAVHQFLKSDDLPTCIAWQAAS